MSLFSNQTLVQRLTDDLRACIMRNQEWDSTSSELYSFDLAQLVFRLCSLNAMDSETALGIVDKSEMLASFVNRDHIHIASRVCRVGSDLAIDLDEALHDNLLDLAAIQGILETISDEDDERQAVSKLVGTWRWTRSVCAGELVKQPVRGRTQALLVLLPGEHSSLAKCSALFAYPRRRSAPYGAAPGGC